jgi:hypothetical protein
MEYYKQTSEQALMQPGTAPVAYRIKLQRQTGMLVMNQRSWRAYTGTYEELSEQYRKAQLHNLFFGWWGIISFFLNFAALIGNRSAMKELNQLVASSGGQAHYVSPSSPAQPAAPSIPPPGYQVPTSPPKGGFGG